MGTDHEFVETNRRIEGGDAGSLHQQNPSSQVRIQTLHSHLERHCNGNTVPHDLIALREFVKTLKLPRTAEKAQMNDINVCNAALSAWKPVGCQLGCESRCVTTPFFVILCGGDPRGIELEENHDGSLRHGNEGGKGGVQ
jgi:hypothetical protein